MTAFVTTSGRRAGKPLLGISRCLLGDPVRFDGGHKRSRYIKHTLQQYFDWYPVCPEVESGMPSPRPSIRQVVDDGQLRVISAKGVDVTKALDYATARRIDHIKERPLRGFIVMSDSPSCGLERVRVYSGKSPARVGVGVFTAALKKACPHLPIEEGGRLNDARLRENFILRVYTYHRFRTLLENDPSVSCLVEFHTEHKYLIIAHCPSMADQLGRLVDSSTSSTLARDLAEYETGLMNAIAAPAKVGNHVTVLQQIVDFLSDQFNTQTRQHMMDTIAAYRAGQIPLITPITLINHYLVGASSGWITRQWYLKPYPATLSLRSQL